MTESVIRRGKDGHALIGTPTRPRPKPLQPRLASGAGETWVNLPLGEIRGRTIASATLTCPVRGSWAAQTLTAWRSGTWDPATLTWNRRPTWITTDEIVQAQPALTAGQLIEIDVTDHVQLAADGTAFYGWRLTTSSVATNLVYGFASTDGPGSWVLTIEFSDAPEQPSDLTPDGGTVGVKPVVSWDFEDFGGDSTEQASFRVQVNAGAPDAVSPDYDSGTVTSVDPQHDMASTAWAGVSSGTVVYWRVLVTDGAGLSSEWSDWASYTYVPKPTLDVTNPGAGVVWDPSPTIAAEVSSGLVKSWQVRIAHGSDKTRILYDSGRKNGTGTDDFTHTIPFKDSDTGKRIFKDDTTYWLNVRVWDRTDREPTPGDRAYIEAWETFVFDDDAIPAAPTSLYASQIGESPRTRLTWIRPSGVAEGWVVERQAFDGTWERALRLDDDEVEQDGTTYSCIYDGARPWMENLFRVRAIDNSNHKQTATSDQASLRPEVKGVWLLGADEGNEVQLAGGDVGNFKTNDRRSTYKPIGLAYDIDIVHAFEGVVGAYTGAIDTRQDWEASRAILLEMKRASSQTVQLVYGTTSVPARLRNLTVAPAPGMMPHTMTHDVSFEAQQVDDFEVSV